MARRTNGFGFCRVFDVPCADYSGDIFTNESIAFGFWQCARRVNVSIPVAPGRRTARRAIRCPPAQPLLARRAGCFKNGPSAPAGLRGGAFLKSETLVGGLAPHRAVRRIRPSIAAIESWRAMIAVRFGPLSRYIPETKSAVCGAALRRRCSAPRAAVDGITHGMLLAIFGASASGRHDATKRWGGQLVNKPVGETAMKIISNSLISAFLARQWGSRTDRGIARDAVPASRVAPCRFHGLRAVHALERLSLWTTTGRQRPSPSFSSPGWATLFVPDSLTPIRLRPCRAVSITPGQYRRWLD